MEIELIEIIEQYIAGNLSRADLDSYASKNKITDIEEKINWVSNSTLAVEQEGLRNQLSDLFEAESSKKSGRIISLNRMKWSIGIAASLLIIVVGYWINFGPDRNPFSNYDYIDPGLPVAMSQSSNYELYDALSYYSEENYSETIIKLNRLVENGNNNDTINYYLGASHLYTNNYDDSKKYLQNVLNEPSSFFYEKSEWLYISNLLKQKDFEEVESRLQSIVKNENHTFYDMALELLNQVQESR